MEQRDSDPGAMLADKGYDCDAIRHGLKDRSAVPDILTKNNRKVRYQAKKNHELPRIAESPYVTKLCY
jgi:hypothetical protein